MDSQKAPPHRDLQVEGSKKFGLELVMRAITWRPAFLRTPTAMIRSYRKLPATHSPCWTTDTSRDQADVVPEWLNLARDMMRARAGLQADKAGRQIGKPAHELIAGYLGAHRDGAALVETEVDVVADRGATGSDDR